MPTGIVRVEDLPKVAQLATGALFYTSQSGAPFNTNTLDILNALNATNTFALNSTLNSSGQALEAQINSLSGASQLPINFGCVLANPTGSWVDIGNFSLAPHNFDMYVSIGAIGVSIAKQYSFTNFFENAPIARGWRELVASYTSGPSNGTEDFAVDFSGNANALSLRLRHNSGTVTGMAQVTIMANPYLFSPGGLQDVFTRTFNTGIATGALSKVSFDNFGSIYYLASNPSNYAQQSTVNTQIGLVSAAVAQTGSNLQNQINNLSINAGVSKINGISGNINIAGAGTTTVSTVGQNITITSTGGGGNLASTIFTTAIDWSVGNTFYSSFTGGLKTITFLNATDGDSITASFSGFATGTLAWPANVKWPNSLVPSPTSGAVDVYTFVQIQNNIYGTVIQNYSF